MYGALAAMHGALATAHVLAPQWVSVPYLSMLCRRILSIGVMP